ncbi:MAG TPA: hypothetical protein PKI55_01785 [Chitinophagaceae bacterium]|nr:hypothetical protein [Chitinophagaceae bacterium]
MKNIENLGKKLDKKEQGKILGGTGDGGGCLPPLAHCEFGLTPCCPGYVCSNYQFNDTVCQIINP